MSEPTPKRTGNKGETYRPRAHNPTGASYQQTTLVLGSAIRDMLDTLVADHKAAYGRASNNLIIAQLIATAHRTRRPFALTPPDPDAVPTGPVRPLNLKMHPDIHRQLADLADDVELVAVRASYGQIVTDLVRLAYAARHAPRGTPEPKRTKRRK